MSRRDSPSAGPPARVLYVGDHRCPYDLASRMTRGLRLAGAEVDAVQEDAQPAEAVLERALDTRPDLLLWTRSWGLAGDADRLLREASCPTAAYDVDLYAGLAREASVGAEPWWRCGTVWTADGGSEALWRARGVAHRWLPAAADPAEVGVAEGGPNGPEVVLLGRVRDYHPEWLHRREMAARLAARYGSRFRVYPGDGEDPVRGSALSRLCSSARVVVCDTISPPGHRGYWSDRVYDLGGRGALMVHMAVPGLEAHLRDGEHLRTFEAWDWAGMLALVDRYLDGAGDERERIRRACAAEVEARHTYRHRAEALLAEGLDSAISPG